MKTQSSMLHVRMDTEMKRKATTALAAMGLTPSEAVRLLFHRIAVDQAFPLELRAAGYEGSYGRVRDHVRSDERGVPALRGALGLHATRMPTVSSADQGQGGYAN